MTFNLALRHKTQRYLLVIELLPTLHYGLITFNYNTDSWAI